MILSSGDKLKRNFVVKGIEVDKSAVAYEKRPPLCDACNDCFLEDKEKHTYTVNSVVIGSYIWGVVCDSCVQKFEKTLKNVYSTDSRDKEEVYLTVERTIEALSRPVAIY